MNAEKKLALRKMLAKPFYWVGFRLVRLGDKIDGKQPRKLKAIRKS